MMKDPVSQNILDNLVFSIQIFMIAIQKLLSC